MGTPDEWLDTVRKCEYLPEQDIKKLCEMVNYNYKYTQIKKENKKKLKRK